jgi:hypothetical protein
MTRRILLVLLVAAIAGLGTAAGASASTLEYGFCNAVKAGTGPYGNGPCTSLGGKLNHVWAPLVEPESVPVAIEKWPTSTTRPKVVFEQGQFYCNGQARTEAAYNGEGEVRGLTFELTECFGDFAQHGEGVCHSAGAPEGTVVTSPLGSVAGVITTGETPFKDKVGIALTPEGGEPFVEVTCGPVTASATGAVIVPVAKNTMITKQKLNFTAKPPQNFVGGPTEVLHGTINGMPLGRAWFEGSDNLTTTRKLELRDCKPGC